MNPVSGCSSVKSLVQNGALTVSLIFVLLGCVSAQAEVDEQGQTPQPQIKVTLENQGPFWVGQQVALSVTLLAPGYFDSTVNFELPDPKGVLLMPPSGHPVVGNETIDDTMFVTQQHDLRLWPMQAGAQSIPPFEVRFSYKKNPLDKDGEPASLASSAIPIKIEAPPGTEGMGTVISARDLTVTETWKPEPGSESVKMGAAFTRTISFSAPDVPGMIFPPFPAPDIDGLGVYSKHKVQDEDDARGSLMGKRQDVMTYIAKRAGQFTIPAVEFHWFDLESKTLKTQSFPAYTLNVKPNPAMASGSGLVNSDVDTTAEVQQDTYTRQWLILIAVTIVLLVGLSFIKGVREWVQKVTRPFRPTHLQPLYPGESKT